MTLEEKATAIEARHDARCDGYDSCGCLYRLLAAVRDEPDPDGEFYRWPIYTYGCAPQPIYGCESPIEYAIRHLHERIAESVYRNNETLVGAQYVGLSAALSSGTYQS